MIKYFTEEADENIKMDVQVGPEEEEVVGPDDEEICNNPVEEAKKNPENVCVACHTDENGVNEYYVDAEDIANLADLNEETMIDALNQVIEVNESSDMCADNLVVVFTEATKEYERNLERHGVICYEADECGVEDIEMDVQVGPNGEEMHAEEDPQEANPVDAVKRGYDSVVIAGQDDKFFMDVEDVQKCAELNCESVIDTLNGIISVNEEYDMNPENIVLICNEDTDEALIDELNEAGVMLEAGLKSGDLSWNRFFKIANIFAKKIKGKFTKDGEANRKYYEARLKEIDETLAKIDEEIEKVKKNPDLEVKYVRKMTAYLAAYAAACFTATALSFKVVLGVPLKKYAWEIVGGSALYGTALGSLGLKGYVEYLNDCKADIKKAREKFQEKLDELDK